MTRGPLPVIHGLSNAVHNCNAFVRTLRTVTVVVGRAFSDVATVIASEAIAVGTLIAERPPHRTVRAAFPHTAPTLGG